MQSTEKQKQHMKRYYHETYKSRPGTVEKARERAAAWRKTHKDDLERKAAKALRERERRAVQKMLPGYAEKQYARYLKKRQNPEFVAKHKAYGKALPVEKRREYQRRSNYGLSPEQFERLFIEQEGECPVCQHPLKFDRTLCVDHDHLTDKVRGLLHVRCNAALGLLKDSPSVCMWAARYLVNQGKSL